MDSPFAEIRVSKEPPRPARRIAPAATRAVYAGAVERRRMWRLMETVWQLLVFLGGGLRSVAPVIGVLLVFQFVVLRQPLENREVSVAYC